MELDEYDGLIVLRSVRDTWPYLSEVEEFARSLAGTTASPAVVTLMIGAAGAEAGLWPRLGTVLDSLCERGVRTVRLALPGAGSSRAGRPALAQHIADAWRIEVIAPEAGVLILPSGSLFALGSSGPGHGWSSFTPGAQPVLLGPRNPAPAWQSALGRLPGRTTRGHSVEQVPAGIVLRPAHSLMTGPGDLCYAAPVDGDHPTVLITGHRPDAGAETLAEGLAALLAALPAAIRSAVRLAPCGPIDLLPTAQDTAEILGAEVEVLTGVPLVVGAESESVVRPLLVGADAGPTWSPFVEAVACRPYGADGTDGPPTPRLLRWRSPIAGGTQMGPGVVRLSDRWQVSVTRAGLRVGPHGVAPALGGRPVAPKQLIIELDLRGIPADDVLFTTLSRLLSELGTDVRRFVALHRIAAPQAAVDEDFRFVRLATEHGVSFVNETADAVERRSGPSTLSTVASGGTSVSATVRRMSPATTGSPPISTAGPPAAPPAQGRPIPDSGPRSLPPMPARISLTPVVLSGPAASPASSGTPAASAFSTRALTARAAAEPTVSPATTTRARAAEPRISARSAETPLPARPAATGPSAVRATGALTSGPAVETGETQPATDGRVVPSPSPAAIWPGQAAVAGGAPPGPPAAAIRRSTEKEREEFRSLAQPVWKRAAAAVNRAMTCAPALRGAQVDAARVDLVAVYLHLEDELAGLGERPRIGEVTDGVDLSDCRVACLLSGLNRLPTYRGVVVRGGLPADRDLRRFAPGTVLREPGPVSALPVDVGGGLCAAAGGYLIWSATGRRIRPLYGHRADVPADEVVFPPGTGFRVLETRTEGIAPLVLLSEVVGVSPGTGDETRALGQVDQVALETLDEALHRQPSSAAEAPLIGWPARCAEPLGGRAGRTQGTA